MKKQRKYEKQYQKYIKYMKKHYTIKEAQSYREFVRDQKIWGTLICYKQPNKVTK